MVEGVIFLGELVLAAAAMSWARWRVIQMIMALTATVIFSEVLVPIWNEPHTSVLRTDPSLFFMPWIAVPAVFIILFSGQNFLQTKRFVWAITGGAALALLGTLIAIGYVNLNSH
jgi:hypothetical protein